MTGTDQARIWDLPAEPGPEVTAGLPAQACGHCQGTGYLAEPAHHITAVIDRHGDRWERAPGHWQWHLARPPHSVGPWYSLRTRGPFTDATEAACNTQTGDDHE